jgi:hypothetical protein
VSEPNSQLCFWCETRFTPRRDGGKRQVFCRPVCRRAFDAAGRRWVAEATASGALTVDALRNGSAATRALPPGVIPSAPVSGTSKSCRCATERAKAHRAVTASWARNLRGQLLDTPRAAGSPSTKPLFTQPRNMSEARSMLLLRNTRARAWESSARN